MRLCPLAQWRVGEAQEADEVDRGDLKGNHERRELGKGPPRTGGESLDPEARRGSPGPCRRKRWRWREITSQGRRGRRGRRASTKGLRETSRFHCRRPERYGLGGCKAMIAQEHRVGLPCGGQHAMHARCVVNAVRRGGAQAPLLCGARGCTVRRGRREAFEAAVQTDPGVRVPVVGIAGRPDDGEEGRRDGPCHLSDQNTLGIAGPLDDVPLEDLQQHASSLLSTCSRAWLLPTTSFITHVLGLLNHALGEHRQTIQPVTPQSPLRSMKQWYILPALQRSQDGRKKRRERFSFAERGNLTLLLPWLTKYTRRS